MSKAGSVRCKNNHRGSFMNAVGIDVSKNKSTVTIRQPGDVVLLPPRDYRHTQSSINDLIETIKGLDGETKVCMEHTGRYYEPMASWLTNAGIFVSAVNPKLIRDFGDESLRAPKTDKADSRKIARFALDRWTKLRQYSPMDETRNQLKTMNRQFNFYTNQKTAMKNNLIALLDQTFPGANDFFESPARRVCFQKHKSKQNARKNAGKQENAKGKQGEDVEYIT